MQRVEIQLKDEERGQLQEMSTIGVWPVRSLQRAQVLLALDKGISAWQIAEVWNLEHTRIWRTRKRYLGELDELETFVGSKKTRSGFGQP